MATNMLLYVLSLFLCLAAAERVLILSPITTKSETILYYAFADRLADRGHDVTVLTTFAPAKPNPKVKFFCPKDYLEFVDKKFSEEFGDDVLQERVLEGPAAEDCNDVWFNGTLKADFAEALLSSKEIKKFLKTERFDLIVLNGGLNAEGLAFVSIFNCPYVYLDGSGFYPWHADSTGNIYAGSSAPTIFSKLAPPFSFWDRIQNTYDNVKIHLAYDKLVQEVEQRAVGVLKEYKLKPFSELDKASSLIFSYRPESLEFPRPFYANVKRFGCVHCRPAKPISQPKTSSFIDSAKDGFFYFSLGSYVKVHSNKDYIKEVFFKAFQKLPNYKFIVKWDEDVKNADVGAPSNVLISNWFSQQDIIAHPKCRGFISHTGLFGTMETVYHAVPVIALPMFWDQDYNANILQKLGVGIKLEAKGLTAEKVFQTLKEMTRDQRYKEAAVRESRILRDHPMDPVDSMVYWSEYVIRHKGADHFRPVDVMNMPWYQLWMVDAVVIFSFIIILLLLLGKRFIDGLQRQNATSVLKKQKQK